MSTERPCRLCGCCVQRTPEGTVDDGMRAHLRTVHPETELHPAVRSTDT